MCTTGINDTGGKFAPIVNGTGGAPLAVNIKIRPVWIGELENSQRTSKN
jgi:hypothetical protein